MSRNRKITFWKRVWWSITRIDKYDVLAKIGFKKSFKYMIKLIAIMCIFVAIIQAYIKGVEAQKLHPIPQPTSVLIQTL